MSQSLQQNVFPEFPFDKVVGLSPATLLKTDYYCKVFSWKFCEVEYLRTAGSGPF